MPRPTTVSTERYVFGSSVSLSVRPSVRPSLTPSRDAISLYLMEAFQPNLAQLFSIRVGIAEKVSRSEVKGQGHGEAKYTFRQRDTAVRWLCVHCVASRLKCFCCCHLANKVEHNIINLVYALIPYLQRKLTRVHMELCNVGGSWIPDLDAAAVVHGGSWWHRQYITGWAQLLQHLPSTVNVKYCCPHGKSQ